MWSKAEVFARMFSSVDREGTEQYNPHREISGSKNPLGQRTRHGSIHFLGGKNTTTSKHANIMGTDLHCLHVSCMSGANHWNEFIEEQVYSQLSM